VWLACPSRGGLRCCSVARRQAARHLAPPRRRKAKARPRSDEPKSGHAKARAMSNSRTNTVASRIATNPNTVVTPRRVSVREGGGGGASVLSRPSTATCSARHGGVHSYCSWDRDGGGELAFAIAIAATATCIWPRTSVYLLSTICSATGTPPSNRLGRPQCRRIQMRMRPGHATEMFGQLVSLRRWFNHGSFQGSLRVIVDPLFCSCRS
jgi:hypothetical protein